jgi:hypothetical protein
VLLRTDGRGTICIGQASHAWLSGQLARAWTPEPGLEPHWEELCLAAGQHDIGMALHDREPLLEPATGGPVGFTALPLEVHLALWDAAPAALETQSAWAALLVSRHGSGLYARRDLSRTAAEDAAAIRGALARWAAREARWAATVGARPADVDRAAALLRTWDALSLALCLQWAPWAGEDVALGADGALSPWPFGASAEVEVRCEGRRLAAPAASRQELAALLAAAERVDLRFVLRRAG